MVYAVSLLSHEAVISLEIVVITAATTANDADHDHEENADEYHEKRKPIEAPSAFANINVVVWGT